ncbi:MAG: C-terminal binding protein [Candidatus Methylomirabilota bacterium]|jgi:D-3-phosphoglycerate dehydrogenase
MPPLLVVLLEDRYPHHQPEKDVLTKIGAEVVEAGDAVSEAAIIDVCEAADGIAVNLGVLSRRVIADLKRCRVIARYGVGYDNVDVQAATERGIAVVNVPDYCTEDVSDQAFALFMACVRQVALRDRELRRGKWNIKGGPIFRVAGKTFGLVGYGNIPQALHRKLKGFALVRVLTFDPFIPKEVPKKNGAELVDLETLLRESDFISVHAPLNERTRHMIGKEQFKRMKPKAIIVNTSRGGVVDTAALYDALKQGLICSAGLDVHEQEPVPKDYLLFELDNVVVSDHIGWYSEESQIELQTKVAQAIANVLTGRLPKSVVNREALSRAGRPEAR